ncbi:MAG: hypothetical protein ABIP94_06785, partial [Planctomycetota bacterium]
MTTAARAAARKQDPENVSDAGLEQVAALRSRFAAPSPAEQVPVVRLDSARPSADVVGEVMSGVFGEDV